MMIGDHIAVTSSARDGVGSVPSAMLTRRPHGFTRFHRRLPDFPHLQSQGCVVRGCVPWVVSSPPRVQLATGPRLWAGRLLRTGAVTRTGVWLNGEGRHGL